jgi:tRNA pseudouridine38-40 synthase
MDIFRFFDWESSIRKGLWLIFEIENEGGMRYKLSLSYDGSDFAGWQRQDNALTVQEVLEEKLSLKLREKISVVGCGRTDSGVHASHFVLHFDTSENIPGNFLFVINNLLPESIALHHIEAVSTFFHARFDAIGRNYVYRLHARKDPFRKKYSYYYPWILEADREAMQKTASSILKYEYFEPFCKSHTDVKTKRCQLDHAYWLFDERNNNFEFHIGSDRFLRGMVRLIVGACIQVGRGKMTVEEVKCALDKQASLPKPLSVPPEGLFLTEIKY